MILVPNLGDDKSPHLCYTVFVCSAALRNLERALGKGSFRQSGY